MPRTVEDIRQMLAHGRLPAREGAIEDPFQWRADALQALEGVAARGLLDRLCGQGEPLRAHLLGVAGGGMAEGLLNAPGRLVLLGELVQNLDHPGRINQGFKGTCAATCVETYLVESDPAEYARLVRGLAAPSGQVPMRSGAILERDEHELVWDRAEGRRSPVSRLFQVSCMEFAYAKLDYDNKTDRQEGERGGKSGVGLHLDAFDHLLESLTGRRWDVASDLHLRMARMLGLPTDDMPDLHKDGLDIIRRSLEGGESAFVTLKVEEAVIDDATGTFHKVRDQLHKVRVLEIDGPRVVFEDPLDPEAPWYKGVDACVLDPYGRASLPADEFTKMMVELSYRPEFFVRG